MVLIVVFAVMFFAWTDNKLVISEYSVDVNLIEPLRIVQLTDLHNRQFGKDNEKLVSEILNQNPDLVVMTGDMINEDNVDISIISSLISKLSSKVPVYYSYGNHELIYEKRISSDLYQTIEKAGAIVLNYQYKDIVVKGNSIRIGGYYGFYWTPHMITDNKEESDAMDEFSSSFEDTDSFKLLLCHIPTTWLDWNRIDDFPIDLVLCGHYHGGQIRIPFIGGLYAPYVGWFPKYTKGLFIGKKANCILSTGLGSNRIVPRINNPPEIVVINLK